jgi:hypothetical protein
MPKPDCGAQREREKGGGPLKVGRLSKTKHDSLIPALQTTSDALVPEPPEGGPGHGRDKGGEKKGMKDFYGLTSFSFYYSFILRPSRKKEKAP